MGKTLTNKEGQAMSDGANRLKRDCLVCFVQRTCNDSPAAAQKIKRIKDIKRQ